MENLLEKGRVPLVRNNGVGKSSMPLKLKARYQEQAYSLLAKHNLYFNYTSKDNHKGSRE